MRGPPTAPGSRTSPEIEPGRLAFGGGNRGRLGATGSSVVSFSSGHGFKHWAAIGEAVADWAILGARPPILAPFALD